MYNVYVMVLLPIKNGLRNWGQTICMSVSILGLLFLNHTVGDNRNLLIIRENLTEFENQTFNPHPVKFS